MTKADSAGPSTVSPEAPKSLREITFNAVALGVLVGVVMSAANVYLGLKAGMTVSASIPAAVISMGILRGLLKRGSLLENNIVQTMASAGESLAAGIIFTMPALVITGIWTGFNFWVTTMVSITGGLLGVLFMIPLRRPMIIENKELTYPEGTACAKVLDAGDRGGAGMRSIFMALGIGALIRLVQTGVGVVGESLHGLLSAGKSQFWLGLNASPALIGVGYIVGFNIALLVFIGGAISWLAGAPILTAITDYIPKTPDKLPIAEGEPGFLAGLNNLAKADVRLFGVGAMVAGGLWSIFKIRQGIARGVKETFSSYGKSKKDGEDTPRHDRDMGRSSVLGLLAATMVAVFVLYQKVIGNTGLSILATVLMVVCSFFFVAVASYIVGLVGSSNSPVSGMTICSVLFTAGLIYFADFEGKTAMLATLAVAGVVCCAACTAGDVCQDLKTGAMLRATPYKQQWMEVAGVIVCSFVMAPVLTLLHNGYGIGTQEHLPADTKAEVLEAPQAKLFATLAEGFFGDETLKWGLIYAGVGIGVLIILLDELWLAPKKSKIRLYVMPVAVGMYLPFGLSTAILLGGLIAWWVHRSAKSEEEAESTKESGVLTASGLIAGEAIMGVLLAVPLAMEVRLPLVQSTPSWLSSLLALAAVVWISQLLRRRPSTA